MRIRRLASLVAIVLLAACAGTPGPGDPGYLYNLAGAYSGQFVVDGQALPATLQIETLPGGAVQGGFNIPMMGIGGEIEGEIVADRFTFTASYTNPESGCDGVAVSEAAISESGASIRGQIEVTECGQFLSGTLRFSR